MFGIKYDQVLYSYKKFGQEMIPDDSGTKKTSLWRQYSVYGICIYRFLPNLWPMMQQKSFPDESFYTATIIDHV